MCGVQWQKVHVFIRSTFNDIHAERDYLVKRVFPELADWCERRKPRLVDADLRWGVTKADATANANVVRTCLKRIDDCRAFFVFHRGPAPAGHLASLQRLIAVEESYQLRGVAAAIAGQGLAVGAAVAARTMPLAPVATGPANFAMPGVTVLDGLVPAEREPVGFATSGAVILCEQQLERHVVTAAGQFHQVAPRRG